MPTVKCIAYNPDNTRCKNNVVSVDDRRHNGKDYWPYTVLCGSHAKNLDDDDPNAEGYGKFKTQYKPEEGKNELYLCRDNNRPELSGKVFFCSEEESKVNGIKTMDLKYDNCGDAYDHALRSGSGGVGGISGIPQSPRTKGSPRPGSPTVGSRDKASKLTSTTIDDKTAANIINSGNICEITTDKKAIPKGIINNVANRNLGKVSEDDVPIYNTYYSTGDSEGVGRRRYLPDLYPDSDIKTTLPYFFKHNKLNILESSLKTIDTTRNATTALKALNTVMETIEIDIRDNNGVIEHTFNPEEYTVRKIVVDMAAKKLGQYMYDERRIELVVTFLFDYAERDMFNPIQYYGFSLYEKYQNNTKANNILNTTAYYLLNIPTGAKSLIDPKIARPRPISPAFKEILDRIDKSIKETKDTVPARSDTGQGSGTGGFKGLCEISITGPMQGNTLKGLITKDNSEIDDSELNKLTNKKYTKDSTEIFKDDFCNIHNKSSINIKLLIEDNASTRPPNPTPGSGGNLNRQEMLDYIKNNITGVNYNDTNIMNSINNAKIFGGTRQNKKPGGGPAFNLVDSFKDFNKTLVDNNKTIKDVNTLITTVINKLRRAN